MSKILSLNRLDKIKNISKHRVTWITSIIIIFIVINVLAGYLHFQKTTIPYDALVNVITDEGTSRGFFISPTLVITEARVGKAVNSPIRVVVQDGMEYDAQLLASGYVELMESLKLGNTQQSFIADNWSLIDISENGEVESYFLLGTHSSLVGDEKIRLITKDETGNNVFRDGIYEKTGPENFLWSLEVRETDIGSPIMVKETEEVVAIAMDLNLSYINNDFPNIMIIPIEIISKKCEESGYPIY